MVTPQSGITSLLTKYIRFSCLQGALLVYQPLDVLINGAEKRLLTKHFGEWHFKTLDAARRSPNPNYNVLPRTTSSKRAFIAL
jgi:hypothetical protein